MSVVIAVCAIVISIWHGVQTRKHNKLSYRPHLTTWTHSVGEKGFYAVDIINNGLGPALIEDFVIKVDGEIISGNQTEPIEKALKIIFPNHKYISQHSFLGKGYSMAAKEKRTIVAVQFTNKPFPAPESVEQAIDRGDVEISYKSFYNETFRLSTEEEKDNKQIHPAQLNEHDLSQ